MIIRFMHRHAALLFLTLCCALVLAPFFVLAESPQQNVVEFEAVVVEITKEEMVDSEAGTYNAQRLRLLGKTGDFSEKYVEFDGFGMQVMNQSVYRVGDRVVAQYVDHVDGEPQVFILHIVRTRSILWLFALFVVAVVLTSGWFGFRAIFGLSSSFAVIFYGLLPTIIAGVNPLFATIGWAILLVILSMYFIFGYNKKSHIAILGTCVGVCVVGFLSYFFSGLLGLTGFAQEEAMYVLDLVGGGLDMQGLLLAGCVIGAIGVLDDLSVSQVSVVAQLAKAKPDISRRELYWSAMNVGRDHIASIVNTLFLAYTGAAFPLLLLFSVKAGATLGFGQAVSTEIVAVEIMRTLTASIGLVLTVPCTTLIAVYVYTKKHAVK